MNSPWGVALAPASFGDHGDQLLVGNFGSGTIMTFDADGNFHGLLVGVDGNPLSIEGLWALTFGNGGRAGVPGTLYFTAGPGDESHGLFGDIEPVRMSTSGHHGRHHGDEDGDDDQDDDDQDENDDGGRISGSDRSGLSHDGRK
ncbi:MAG TPA: TIGR03118 family protein [Candidatus Dormibacteraeota bacterium]|nr:TIGR03118 family protein [Candidatus Dormibacteraeota bacterium]